MPAGCPRAIVHFYNATNPLQRQVVFGLDKPGIIEIATTAARICRRLESALKGTDVRYEYSPESFTLTEPEFAVEVCQEVMKVIAPTTEKKIILNLPETVECYSSNVYGDVIEWFGRTIKDRDKIVLSLHPHNDRGCAVDAAEFGVLAGADRVEGTLFGNGERTGNVGVVTLAMAYLPTASTRCSTSAISMQCVATPNVQPPPVHQRPPLCWRSRVHGIFRQPPRRHQERFRPCPKTMTVGVPYLPIDPKHVGRSYEAVIRVNSQSGKGGVAYVMKTEYGFDLPRRLQIEFSREFSTSPKTRHEITPAVMWDTFQAAYLRQYRNTNSPATSSAAFHPVTAS